MPLFLLGGRTIRSRCSFWWSPSGAVVPSGVVVPSGACSSVVPSDVVPSGGHHQEPLFLLVVVPSGAVVPSGSCHQSRCSFSGRAIRSRCSSGVVVPSGAVVPSGVVAIRSRCSFWCGRAIRSRCSFWCGRAIRQLGWCLLRLRLKHSFFSFRLSR